MTIFLIVPLLSEANITCAADLSPTRHPLNLNGSNGSFGPQQTRPRNRALDRKGAEDKAAKRKTALTKAGESTSTQANRPWRTFQW